MNPLRLGHVHLKVRDVDLAASFYKDLLGLVESERIGNMIFLSNGHDHHTVALQALGSQAAGPLDRQVGLYHTAFEVSDETEYNEALIRARQLSPWVQTVDHGISWAMYLQDPDGNGIEIYQDRRQQPGGREFWGGSTENARS
jgi:catechol 2,3-dioxygenase